MRAGWSCAGVGWREGLPVLRWARSGDGEGAARRVVERESVLRAGEAVGFRVLGERRCLGVWRAGRRHACPTAEVIPGGGTRAQCASCARLDRARSVAADTYADDPRPYRVYLAWFGDGLVKVGITGQARGAARLLEQGAVAFSWLGSGPLMAARRAEEAVRSGLGVPDRVPYERKRAARLRIGADAGERAREVARVHAQAVALPGWPETLERSPCRVVDHADAFGLPLPVPVPGPRGAGALGGLGEGVAVSGVLLGVAGPDLHLAVDPSEADGGPPPEGPGAPSLVFVDTRVLAGWPLAPVGAGEGTTPGLVRPLRGADEGEGEGDAQAGLF
ncbi:DUF2797 domain-containing protein [Streptomyces sp. NPDC049954]|uniref:DUF2797 domain-containing protein n=1 Tax=Streptomyces sp. NPDC049954 TaxID=3155779 RepID=UPI003446A43F